MDYDFGQYQGEGTDDRSKPWLDQFFSVSQLEFLEASEFALEDLEEAIAFFEDCALDLEWALQAIVMAYRHLDRYSDRVAEAEINTGQRVAE